MNLEEKLLSEYGNKRPFKLPEGYFDNLDEQIDIAGINLC